MSAPLTRPSATLSPSDGERDGVRGVGEFNRFIFRNWYHTFFERTGVSAPLSGQALLLSVDNGLSYRQFFSMQNHLQADSAAGLHAELEMLFEETVDLANQLKSKARRTHRGELLSASGRILLQSLQLHGAQTVPALAHIRSTSRQNIQVLVDRLADAGYVEFISNPGHKRSDLVALTEAGRALLASANEREAGALETLLPHTTEAEVKAAAQLLRKLRLLLGGERKRRKTMGHMKSVEAQVRIAAFVEPVAEDADELPVSLL